MNEKTPTKGKPEGERAGGAPPQDEGAFELKDSLTFFAGIASLLYILGLFVLWVPIRKAYTHDFVTAWQAASLVPRTVVAGLGVMYLVALPLAVVVFILVMLRLVDWFLQRRIKAWYRRSHTAPKSDYDIDLTIERLCPEPVHHWTSAFIVGGFLGAYTGWWLSVSNPQAQLVGLLVLFLGAVFMCFGLGLAAALTVGEPTILSKNPPSRKWRSINVWTTVLTLLVMSLVWWFFLRKTEPPFQLWGALEVESVGDALVTCVVISLVIYAALVAGFLLPTSATHKRWPSFWTVLWAERWRSWGALITAIFLAAFILTYITKPPLPKAQLTTMTDGIRDGALLAHTDSFWYLFVEEGKDKGELIAVPDSKVKTGRVFSGTRAEE